MNATKKILALLLTLCLSASVLCACVAENAATEGTTAPSNNDNTPPEEAAYRFVVINEDNKPVKGAKIQLYAVVDGKETTGYAPVESDENGEVVYDKIPQYGSYAVKIIKSSIPGGYEFANSSIVTTADVHGYALVLKSKCSHAYNAQNICTKCDRSKPCLANNPNKICIGYVGSITMDEKRVDDLETMKDEWEKMFATSYDDSLYYISVTPYKPEHVGRYRISITGLPEGVEAYVGLYPSTGSSYVAATPSASATGHDPELEFNVEERYLVDETGAFTYENSWLFGIRLEGTAKYPVSINISVERIRDLIPGQDYIKTDRLYPKAEGTKTVTEVMGDLSGKTLHTIGAEEAREMNLVLGADGYYHIGSADGAILMVNLTNNNVFYGNASFQTVNSIAQSISLYTQVKIDEMHFEVTYYQQMVDGYAPLCNDGYYMVNEQLYNFLRELIDQQIPDIQKQDLDKDHAFLLACGYYK